MLSLKLKTVRSSVTRSINKLTEECNLEHPRKENVQKYMGELISNRDRLLVCHKEKETELEKMLEENPEDQGVMENAEREIEKMEKYLSEIDCVLAEGKVNIERVESTTEVEKNHIRLPKISLPTFGGNILEWIEFKECFDAAINETNLNDVEKFAYLKGQLSGGALSTISGLSLTSKNYAVAFDLLSEKYGDKGILIRAHIRELLALESVSNTNSVNFQNFVDKILIQTRSLQSLGVSKDNFDIFLSEIVLCRIPYNLKLAYLKFESSNQTLENLLHLLQKELKCIEAAKTAQNEKDPCNQNFKRLQNFSKKPIETKSLNRNQTSLSFSSVSKTMTCLICKNNSHKTRECRLMLDLDNVDDRIELIKKHRICFNCLGPHFSNNCTSKGKCSHCGKSHHSLIHKAEKTSQKITSQTTLEVKNNTSMIPVVNLNLVTVENNSFEIGALLDTGSHRSFISADCCINLKYKVVSKRHYTINGFGNSQFENELEEIECKFFDQLSEKWKPIRFLKFPSLSQNVPSSLPQNLVHSVTGESSYKIPQVINAIIGCDNFYKIVTWDIKILPNDMCAIKTRSGWSFLGSSDSRLTNASFLAVHTLPQFPDVCIEQFWKTETLEEENLVPLPEKLSNIPTINEENGRYIVKFPWKSDKILSLTYETPAMHRLKFVVKKLVASCKLKEYDKIMKGYLENDIAEEVPDLEPPGRVRILPHHPVFKPGSTTTKMRIVLDASAKSPGGDFSINDCLHAGSNHLSNLLGVLLRFRQGKYAMISDIEKAFLQLELDVFDRDAVRFLWYRETLENNEPKEKPIAYRMKRLPFGIKSSPYLLCSTIRFHIKKYESKFPKTVSLLHNNLYMDDFVFSSQSKEEALRVKEESVRILSEMKMNLTKWRSNFDNSFSAEDFLSVLGVSWSPSIDCLILSIDFGADICTKRQLASFVCGIWDPFGCLSPVVFKYKLCLQSAWRQNISWDETLPTELIDLVKSENDTFKVNVPRNIVPNEPFELHCYADASSLGYGACAYIRTFTDNNDMKSSNILIAKSRLAPMKGTTIPRLELMAAVLASKLVDLVLREIEKPKTIKMYSDSQVVLCWVKNVDKTYNQFINRRVEIIRKLTQTSEWNYVPSKRNPADIISRGCSTTDLKNSDLWWTGGIPTTEEPIETEEVRTNICLEISCNLSVENNRQPLVNLKHYSSWKKLLRIMCYVMRFINICRGNKITKNISNDDIEIAQRVIVRNVQENLYENEIQLLKNGNCVPKSSSIVQLNPFFDKGSQLLKVNTRLDNSFLPDSEIFPILLPFNAELDRVIILYYHEKLLHCGVSLVLSEMRQKYWLPKGRKRIKSVIKNCNLCKRRTATNNKEKWAALPTERVDCREIRAFQNIGLDYFGPIMSKTGKIYVLLITCLQVRSVHLELVPSLETAEFLNAFSRFSSRRGVPKTIYSDNAKTFKGAEVTVFNVYGCTWKYIIERAPSKGGAWERLVQTVKIPLRIIVRNQVYTIWQLQTLLAKIEMVVNRRPLTYVSENTDDVKPIRPCDFLLPPYRTQECSSSECSYDDIVKSLLIRDRALDYFYTRWKTEFLKERLVTGIKSGERKIEEGMVVLIDDGRKREFWPLARILKVFKGRDQVVRSCLLTCKGKTFRRGIERIFPLELPGECVENKT